MTAPFAPSNRFDILVPHEPNAVDGVLAHFSSLAAKPSSVNTRSHRDGTLSVVIIVEKLAETRARAIQTDLKKDARVIGAMLEHYVG